MWLKYIWLRCIEDGVIYDSPNDILKEEANYFRQMVSFPSHPLPLNEDYGKELFPNNIKHGKLTNVQKDPCKGQITEEEAIKSFQSGKTPGLNGIPVDVYQYFFDMLKAPLLDCFNYSFRNGGPSGTQQEGLISLLFKQDPDCKYKDPVYLKRVSNCQEELNKGVRCPHIYSLRPSKC